MVPITTDCLDLHAIDDGISVIWTIWTWNWPSIVSNSRMVIKFARLVGYFNGIGDFASKMFVFSMPIHKKNHLHWTSFGKKFIQLCDGCLVTLNGRLVPYVCRVVRRYIRRKICVVVYGFRFSKKCSPLTGLDVPKIIKSVHTICAQRWMRSHKPPKLYCFDYSRIHVNAYRCGR